MISKFTRACAQFLGKRPPAPTSYRCASDQVSGHSENAIAGLKDIARDTALSEDELALMIRLAAVMLTGAQRMDMDASLVYSLQQRGYVQVHVVITDEGRKVIGDLIAVSGR